MQHNPSRAYQLRLCESKQQLESPIAECDVDYLLKNQNAEEHQIRFPDQKGYWPTASPITTSPSPVQQQSRLFSTSRQPSSCKPKLSDSIGVERMRREEAKLPRDDMAGFAKGMATTSGWTLVRCDCRNRIHQVRQRRVARA